VKKRVGDLGRGATGTWDRDREDRDRKIKGLETWEEGRQGMKETLTRTEIVRRLGQKRDKDLVPRGIDRGNKRAETW
jgi:hypothetical protein